MIDKIYKNKYALICDNCGDGEEIEGWENCMEFMRENEWKKKLVNGKFENYCPECQEGWE